MSPKSPKSARLKPKAIATTADHKSVILALDCCGRRRSVALRVAGRLPIALCEPEAPVSHGEGLTLLVARTLATAAVTFPEITLIAVTRGPGSFTGTRIGLAAAQGLALALGCPLVGATRFQLQAAALGRHQPTPNLAVVLDCRGRDLACCCRQGSRWHKPFAAPPEDIAQRLSAEPWMLTGDGLPRLIEATHGVWPHSWHRPTPESQTENAAARLATIAARWRNLEHHRAEPLYLSRLGFKPS